MQDNNSNIPEHLIHIFVCLAAAILAVALIAELTVVFW